MSSKNLYILLAGIRVFMLIFQTGYIHPDEFFQSIEVVSGDVFNIRIKSTWEFNATQPLRSMATLQPFVRWPLLAYKQVLASIDSNLSSFLLLLIPRMCTTLFSFVNDYFIYRFCQYFGISWLPALLFYASSHFALILSTRTLSNTWETACLSLFGILAVRQVTIKSYIEKVLLSFFEGCLIAFSFFCRPTALIFLFPQVFIFLFVQRNLLFKFFVTITMLLGFLITATFCVTFDTFYYKKIWLNWTHFMSITVQLYELIILKSRTFIDLSKIVVTPVNFILYNLDGDHLAKHGLHPWYTHLAVNLPQLLGPLYILGLLTPFLPAPDRHRRLAFVLLGMLLFPIASLSLFVHQEARFLLPVIPLWIVLCSLGFDTWIKTSRRFLNRLIAIWLVFNLGGVLFWGFLHQGGLTTLLTRLSSQIDRSPHPRSLACSTIVFYRTYMPPEMLLLRPALGPSDPVECGSVVDLGGIKETDMRDYVARLRQHILQKELPMKYTTRKIYLIFPSSGQPQDVRMEVFGSSSLVGKVFGHVSGEHPPDLYPYAWPHYQTVLYYWSTQLSLLCYSITIK